MLNKFLFSACLTLCNNHYKEVANGYILLASPSLTIYVFKALWDGERFGLEVCHPLLVVLLHIHKLKRLPLEQAEEKHHRPHPLQ